MKKYKSLEEWRNRWTPEKRKLYEETKERKYGKDTNNLIIDDRELSEITREVVFTINVSELPQITDIEYFQKNLMKSLRIPLEKFGKKK
jgi:hypothetical protein